MKKYLLAAAAFMAVSSVFCADFISASDSAVGWASFSGAKDLAGQVIAPPSANGANGGLGSSVVVTVSSRSELLAALHRGDSRIIYIKGIIDMTDTGRGSLLPEAVDGSNARLDRLIQQKTENTALPVKGYLEWKDRYTASFDYDEDQGGDVKDVRALLNDWWKNLVVLRIPSNTTLIGLDGNSGITGGSVSIVNAQNVVVRNLDISNCYNPFPKVEKSDGLNADLDCISIQRSQWVWIDHCSVHSRFSHAEIESDKHRTKDGLEVKWQVYDGLCDITNTNDFITISWCKFYNHDKTMLIGNSDRKVEDRNHQTITIHHCWFDNCTQRLPMVRFATIHIFNCYYSNTESRGIDRRAECRIYSEANCFTDKEKSVTRNTFGSMYDKGSLNIKTAGLSSSPEWNPSDYYSYTADSAENVERIVKAGAGNGAVEAERLAQ